MSHGKFSVIVGSCSEYANIVQGYWWINNPDSPNNYVCSGWSQLSQSIAENSGTYSLLFRGSWDPQIFLSPCAKWRKIFCKNLFKAWHLPTPWNHIIMSFTYLRQDFGGKVSIFLFCYVTDSSLRVLTQDTLPA